MRTRMGSVVEERGAAGGVRLVLASASPRRAKLLREAGFEAVVEPPPIDDGRLDPGGRSPERWVLLLARLKARLALARAVSRGERGALVLAADTVVEKEGEIIGQARDAGEAGRIVRRVRGGGHRVLTGVCLAAAGRAPRSFVDVARVRVGAISEEEVERYVASGEWRGKAGAYNLEERLGAGWPIAYEGDPGTIMGLPMRRLGPMLREALA